MLENMFMCMSIALQCVCLTRSAPRGEAVV